MKKYYAIKEGYDKEDGIDIVDTIVNTWGDCQRFVLGVKGAKYKSFETLEEAKKYLQNYEDVKITSNQMKSQIPYFFVDGSYNMHTGKYGYASVMLIDNVIVHIDYGHAVDKKLKHLRQIAGELHAAKSAIMYASENGFSKIALVYDYEGIHQHGVGTWGCKDDSSLEYYNFVQSYLAKGLSIQFVKAKSHSGEIYNEIADAFAKYAIDVPLTTAVRRYLKENELVVLNEKVREELSAVVDEEYREKIKIAMGGINMSGIDEKFIRREEKYRGNIISVDMVHVELSNGKPATRDLVVHPGAACVIPLNENGEIHLVKQFRSTIGKAVLEIPAGKLDKGEDPLKCAIRELHEETGLEAENIKHLISFNTAIGFSNEILHLYLATGLKEGEVHADEDEFLTNEKIKLDRLVEMVMNNEIEDSKTVIAILMVDKLMREV